MLTEAWNTRVMTIRQTVSVYDAPELQSLHGYFTFSPDAVVIEFIKVGQDAAWSVGEIKVFGIGPRGDEQKLAPATNTYHGSHRRTVPPAWVVDIVRRAAPQHDEVEWPVWCDVPKNNRDELRAFSVIIPAEHIERVRADLGVMLAKGLFNDETKRFIRGIYNTLDNLQS